MLTDALHERHLARRARVLERNDKLGVGVSGWSATRSALPLRHFLEGVDVDAGVLGGDGVGESGFYGLDDLVGDAGVEDFSGGAEFAGAAVEAEL